MNGSGSHQPQTIADVLAKFVPGIAALRNHLERRQEAAAPAPQIIANDQQPQETEQRKEEPQVVFWLASARLAIALNLTVYLIVWLALHHINRQSGADGTLSTNKRGREAIARLTGLSPDRIRVILKDGDGTWWKRLPGSHVRLIGQEKIAGDLVEKAIKAGIPNPKEYNIRCQLPISLLQIGILGFQGYIFDAWLAEYGDHGHMEIWAALERLWGHSRPQLNRWMEAAGTIKQHNAGCRPFPSLSPNDNLDEATRYYQEFPHEAGCSHPGLWFEVHNNQVYLYFQRGNTYYSKHGSRRTQTAGKARKVNQAIRRRAGDFGDEIIRDAFGLPGGFITHPNPDPVGMPAGHHLTDVLGKLFPSLDGSSVSLLSAWNRLIATGRIFWKRTNFRESKAFYKARQKRPDDNLYMFQTAVRFLRSNQYSRTKWWGIWLHTGPGA